MFSCPTCRKCCCGFGLRTWSILPPWFCCSPHKEGSGLLGQPPTTGGDLCPAPGPAGSAWSPWHTVLCLHNPAQIFSSQGQRFRAWVADFFFFFFGLSLFPAPFFKVPAIPWKGNPKSRRGGKPIQHIINGRSRSGQALGQSPSLAPHSKVQARLSNDLTAISDPDTAPALFPTHWFLVAEV